MMMMMMMATTTDKEEDETTKQICVLEYERLFDKMRELRSFETSRTTNPAA
jgi:hypothetical protein